MPRLDDTAIEEGLQRLPGWERRGNQIVKTFARLLRPHDDLRQRGRLRGRGSRPPPDIDIRWNNVTLTRFSHAGGG
jgi:pterin-4a-carbinolamine dehydratase